MVDYSKPRPGDRVFGSMKGMKSTGSNDRHVQFGTGSRVRMAGGELIAWKPWTDRGVGSIVKRLGGNYVAVCWDNTQQTESVDLDELEPVYD